MRPLVECHIPGERVGMGTTRMSYRVLTGHVLGPVRWSPSMVKFRPINGEIMQIPAEYIIEVRTEGLGQ